MAAADSRLRIKLQIFCGDEIAMGPGKAQLLDAIVSERSISGAARALGMSYRRAWLLVDTMNRCWREPLVLTSPGSTARGGGARLTQLGEHVLKDFGELQAYVGQASSARAWSALREALLPQPRARQKPGDKD